MNTIEKIELAIYEFIVRETNWLSEITSKTEVQNVTIIDIAILFFITDDATIDFLGDDI